MRRTAALPAVLSLALLVGVAGCADEPSDAGSPPVTSPPVASDPATTPTVPEASEPPFSADTRPDDGGYGSGNGLGLTGVRTARQAGYDRVVFDLGGKGTPGWYVDYTASPTADGSGDPVAVEGTVYLQVVLRGMGLPFDTGIEPFGDDTTRIQATGTEGVTEIAPGGVFEGDQVAFIGLTGAERPFRVFALADPARVVVDVQHG